MLPPKVSDSQVNSLQLKSIIIIYGFEIGKQTSLGVTFILLAKLPNLLPYQIVQECYSITHIYNQFLSLFFKSSNNDNYFELFIKIIPLISKQLFRYNVQYF